MKFALLFIGLLTAELCAGPAMAQNHSHNGMGDSSVVRDNTRRMTDVGATTGPDSAALARLNGQSHADYIADLVYQDRRAIKGLKKQAKAAVSDEEREELNRQIALLEADIIALQQQ